jgi:hypothetical protein
MDLEKICDYLGWNLEIEMYWELEWFQSWIEDTMKNLIAGDYAPESND